VSPCRCLLDGYKLELEQNILAGVVAGNAARGVDVGCCSAGVVGIRSWPRAGLVVALAMTVRMVAITADRPRGDFFFFFFPFFYAPAGRGKWRLPGGWADRRQGCRALVGGVRCGSGGLRRHFGNQGRLLGLSHVVGPTRLRETAQAPMPRK